MANPAGHCKNCRRTLARSLDALVAVIDDCDRALAALPLDQRGFHQGFQMIRDGAIEGAKDLGAQPFTSFDGVFDPRVHEAVAAEPGGREGQIARAVQRGWRTERRVLRPARVIVYEGGEAPAIAIPDAPVAVSVTRQPTRPELYAPTPEPSLGAAGDEARRRRRLLEQDSERDRIARAQADRAAAAIWGDDETPPELERCVRRPRP